MRLNKLLVVASMLGALSASSAFADKFCRQMNKEMRCAEKYCGSSGWQECGPSSFGSGWSQPMPMGCGSSIYGNPCGSISSFPSNIPVGVWVDQWGNPVGGPGSSSYSPPSYGGGYVYPGQGSVVPKPRVIEPAPTVPAPPTTAPLPPDAVKPAPAPAPYPADSSTAFNVGGENHPRRPNPALKVFASADSEEE